MPPDPLRIEDAGNATIVSFTDSAILDVVHIERIARRLYGLPEDGRTRLILDFTMVKALSSPAIGVLINLKKRLHSRGGSLVLCGLTPELRRLFEIVRLDTAFHFADDIPAAQKAMGADAT